MGPEPTPDPTPFFIDFKDARNFFFTFRSYNLPVGTLSFILFYFLLKFCGKNLFCKHYFSPLNPFMKKGNDPEIREAQKHADSSDPDL
jgi:hypothetical protein